MSFWHYRLLSGVISAKKIVIPSARIDHAGPPLQVPFPGPKIAWSNATSAGPGRAGRATVPKMSNCIRKAALFGRLFRGLGPGASVDRRRGGGQPTEARQRSGLVPPLTADAGAGRGKRQTRDPAPWASPVSSNKLEQSFENRTKLQAPCNRWAVSTHDNKELVKPFPFTLFKRPWPGYSLAGIPSGTGYSLASIPPHFRNRLFISARHIFVFMTFPAKGSIAWTW